MSEKNDAISKLIAAAKKDFQKKYKESETDIIRGSEEPEATGIIVDNPMLEYILDRRFLAYGRCYLAYGKKGASKTSLFFELAKIFQRIGGLVVWIETEHAIDKEYAKNQGVDVDNMIISHPQTLEEGLTIAKTFIDNMPTAFPDGDVPVLICLDSIAGTVTDYEDDKDVLGGYKPGEHARILSDFYSRIIGPLANEKCMFLALNQLKDQIGGMPSFNGEAPEAMKGGHAPRFHSTYQFKMVRTKDLIAKEEDNKSERKIGSRHKITATRNKLGREGNSQAIEFDMYIKGGIDWYQPLVRLLGDEYPSLLKASGGWYSWVPTNTSYIDPVDGTTKIINAEERLRERDMAQLIANSPEARELIRNAFGIRPLPSQAEVQAVEAEIKKKRKKKSDNKEL